MSTKPTRKITSTHKRNLLERRTVVHLEEYDQHVNVIELFDDQNVCQRILFTDWANDDITNDISEKLRMELIKLVEGYHQKH